MSLFQNAREAQDALFGFFERFAGFDSVVREMLDGETFTALLDVREPNTKAIFDLTSKPLRVVVDPPNARGTMSMTAKADIMHEMFLGLRNMGKDVNEKLLVVRGPTPKMMAFMPLMEMAPPLYRQHLILIGREDLLRGAPDTPLKKETPMKTPSLMEKKATNLLTKVGDVLDLEERKTLVGAAQKLLYPGIEAAGYAFGMLRGTVLKKVDMFAIMERFVKGLDEAEAVKQSAGGGN